MLSVSDFRLGNISALLVIIQIMSMLISGIV